MSQAGPAETLPIPQDLTRPVENTPTLSTTLDITQPVVAAPAWSALVDSRGQLRAAPAPLVVLETRYSGERYESSLISYTIPLRELPSWLALKNVLENIRKVDTKRIPIVYYSGTVVIGKYWPDIVHDGAKFVVLYTFDINFADKAGVSQSEYWAIE